MNKTMIRIIMIIIGIVAIANVMIFEIDGTFGFLLATLGLFLIIIGLTLRGIIHLLAKIL